MTNNHSLIVTNWSFTIRALVNWNEEMLLKSGLLDGVTWVIGDEENKMTPAEKSVNTVRQFW